MTIDVPFIEDKDLQQRFENWLTKRGHRVVKKKRSIVFFVHIENQQQAFTIGANYLAISMRLFDGPLTRTLSK